LDIQQLRTYYYVPEGVIRAIDGVNLRINEKEIVGIVGESGCGKSSLALSITRMISSPTGRIVDGKILYRGKNLLEMSEDEMTHVRGKEISVVFQDPMTYLNPSMKISKQITEKIILHDHVSKREATDQAIKLLKSVQMPSPETVMNSYPYQLSGGMLQRVLLVIALACRPSLIIADEPTTALDVTVQAQILDVLRGMVEGFNTSIIMITHDMGIAAEICDRVYVMYAGKVVEGSTVDEIFGNPQHPYTSALLGSVLRVEKFQEELTLIGGSVPNLINPPLGCRFHPRCINAMNVCREQAPPPFALSLDHFSSCWLLNDKNVARPN
jgi:oligopeptide/dipeptide ABC transporter ATP-binding protein